MLSNHPPPRGAAANPDGRGRALLIGGGIANFTDVAATFKGIIQALREQVGPEGGQGVERLGLSKPSPPLKGHQSGRSGTRSCTTSGEMGPLTRQSLPPLGHCTP
jgi:hypothetical protein